MRIPAVMALLLALAAPVESEPAVAQSSECSRAPLVPRDKERVDLDENAEAWGAFCDRGTVHWAIGNVTSPSLDGRSLLCQVQGGSPYAGVHCYREFEIEPDANWFELSLAFRLHPTTSCNNVGVPSVVQALEFAINKWQGGTRYELALQWQNVNQVTGDGAPQWRWWDGSRLESERWVPFTPPFGQCLEGDRWYTLALRGRIGNGLIRYETFSLDGVEHQLNVVGTPMLEEGPDRFAIAVQANLNKTATPYDVFLDQVTFLRGPITQTRGSTWYSDGSFVKSGPAGTTVSAFSTGAQPNRAYRLVTAAASGPYQCSGDPVAVNPLTRYSNSRGFISTTTGAVWRPPGTYQLCFYETTPGVEVRHIALPVWFTVN